MYLLKILIVSSVLTVSVSAQLAPASEKPPATVTVVPEQRVSVMFSAMDAKGNPIHDVSKDQVLVYENNQAAQTLEVQNVSGLPLHLGIVLLTSKKTFDQEQAAAIDLVQKLLKLAERHSLTFRTDFFNIFSQPSGVDISTPTTFGRITSTAVPARIIQFGLKYEH